MQVFCNRRLCHTFGALKIRYRIGIWCRQGCRHCYKMVPVCHSVPWAEECGKRTTLGLLVRSADNRDSAMIRPPGNGPHQLFSLWPRDYCAALLHNREIPQSLLQASNLLFGFQAIDFNWLHLKPPPSPLVYSNSSMIVNRSSVCPRASVAPGCVGVNSRNSKIGKDTWNHGIM